MKLAFLFLLIWSTISQAHEVILSTQHVDLRRLNETGWQHDVVGKMTAGRKLDLGLQATYLERFDLFEKRAGAFVIYQPMETLTLEMRALFGHGNEILPEEQFNLNGYYALGDGFTPFAFYRDSRYSVTHLHTLNLGVEIEKVRNFILIPQVMSGKATFKRPAETENVHNYGARVVYYQEQFYSVFAFGYKGKEASQGIIGRSTALVSTLTGGVGGSYYFVPQLKTELTVDHTDYDELKTSFLTTTLNLIWGFE